MGEPVTSVPIPSGADRERHIYTLGLTGGSLSSPIPLSLLEEKAKEILSPPAYDYVAGVAGGEQGVRAVALNLLADLDLTLALSGHSTCRTLDASALAAAP